MKTVLTVRAGQRARQILCDEGLRPERVRVVAGAAGGPKWLVLNALDRFLFGGWLDKAGHPLFLVGSSIGAWRFAAATTEDPAAAINRFETAYIGQRYRRPPTSQEVSAQSRRIQTTFLGPKGPAQVLSHPRMRISVLAVRCRGGWIEDGPLRLAGHLSAAALANLASRRLLGLFFERVLFYDPRDQPPFFEMDGFPLRRIPLTEQNLVPALLASGAVPLLMAGVRGIAGGPEGIYRDGGLIDYHLDIPFGIHPDEIVLFPHYRERIVPGWFDKHLAWRRPRPEHMQNVVQIAPSSDFVAALPYGKIPDRQDFYNFKGRDGERIAYWFAVVRQSRRLAEAFAELAAAGPLGDRVQLLR
jgi:hypothetical protein